MANDRTHEEVILMSNASCETFPENRPHHFTVRLGSPLQLSGKWECAMTQILYPNKWANIRSRCTFKMCWTTKHKSTNVITPVGGYGLIKSGYYAGVDDLVKDLNDEIRSSMMGYRDVYKEYEFVTTPITNVNKHAQNPKIDDVEIPFFTFLNDASKVCFTEGQILDFKIEIGEGFDLWKAIGYKPGTKEITKRTEITHFPSLTMNFPALYVYTPILTAWRVGDTAAPLLSLVPMHGKYNHYGENEPARLQYREVSQSYISEIEVKIMDSHGKEVQFGDGIVGIELHFRRIA